MEAAGEILGKSKAQVEAAGEILGKSKAQVEAAGEILGKSKAQVEAAGEKKMLYLRLRHWVGERQKVEPGDSLPLQLQPQRDQTREVVWLRLGGVDAEDPHPLLKTQEIILILV